MPFWITRDTFGDEDDIWRAAVHQEDMQRIDDEIQMSLRVEKEFDTEFRIVWPDGTIRNIRAISTLQRDSFGKPLRMIGTNKDITEEKRAIEALARINQTNELILNSAAEGILGLDLQGNHTFVNPAAAKMLGYTAEELIGQPSHSCWHHSRSDGSLYPKEDCPILKAALDGAEHRESNSMFWRKDCTGFPSEYVSTPILEQGQVSGVVVTFSDMTERKRAEEKLRESEQRFMNVIQSSADAILLVDGGQIMDCNEATTRMLGYSDKNQFMMAHPAELYPPTQSDGRNSFEKANEMMRIASDNGFHQFEWEQRRADGELFLVQVSLTSIVLHGKNVIYCMWRDITERKRTAEELRRTIESLNKAANTTIQVLVSAVEVKDPYTGGHQLRTANLALAIAIEMELSPNIIDGIHMAGSIHDLGKLSVPSEILSKPTKLTPIEFALIKEHSQHGYEILKDVESPWPLAEIIYQHHERMGGSGYPRNMKGNEIFMEARIIGVADVVESMSSHRPYRPALGIDAALNEIEKNRGTNYDNAVVDACLKLFREKGFMLEAGLT